MSSLVKARAARKAQLDQKRQEEEAARKIPETPKVLIESLAEPLLKNPTDTKAIESPPTPIIEPKEPTKVIPEKKKLLHPSDLFLIPPNFSFVTNDEQMDRVSIIPVPLMKIHPQKKNQSVPSSSSSSSLRKQQQQPIQKKRKREEESSSEEDSEEDEKSNSSSANKEKTKSFQSNFQKGGGEINQGTGKPGGSSSPSLVEKARGILTKTTSYLPAFSDSIRSNMVLSALSICLIIVRGALQKRHIGKTQNSPVVQNTQAGGLPASLPPTTNNLPPISYMNNVQDFKGYGR